MESFKEIVLRLTKHPDRHIKGASMNFIKNLQQITEYLDNLENNK